MFSLFCSNWKPLGKAGNSPFTPILPHLPSFLNIQRKQALWLASEGTWVWVQLHPGKSRWNNNIRYQVFLQGHHELCDFKSTSCLSLPFLSHHYPQPLLTRDIVYQVTEDGWQITPLENYDHRCICSLRQVLGELGVKTKLLVLNPNNISCHNLETIFFLQSWIFFLSINLFSLFSLLYLYKHANV